MTEASHERKQNLISTSSITHERFEKNCPTITFSGTEQTPEQILKNSEKMYAILRNRINQLM